MRPALFLLLAAILCAFNAPAQDAPAPAAPPQSAPPVAAIPPAPASQAVLASPPAVPSPPVPEDKELTRLEERINNLEDKRIDEDDANATVLESSPLNSRVDQTPRDRTQPLRIGLNAAYVPLLQTLVWPLFLAILIAVFRSHFSRLLDAFRRRIEEGSSFKAGPFEIGENLRSLDYRPPSSEQQQTAVAESAGEQEDQGEWAQKRTGIYQQNRGIFLAHVLTPPRRAREGYDIYIYLIRHASNESHRPRDLSDVAYAEFFLGHMWGNRVFRETPHDGMIGMSTYAYSPFLCICRVHLRDGSVVKLDRYIDFEMGDFYNRKHPNSARDNQSPASCHLEAGP